MITLIVGVYIFQINIAQPRGNYIAQKGVLDLSNWQMDQESIITLDGEWEFYPGLLLKPGEITREYAKEAKTYIQVPASWKGYLGDKELSEGSGTYRLKIKLKDDYHFAVKIKTVRLAYRAYLNDKEIISSGVPSLNREQFKPESLYKMGMASSSNQELELIIQVSNYDYPTGGILRSLEFGAAESMISANTKAISLELIIIAALLVVGFFFFMIFTLNTKEYYLLYFSLATLTLVLFVSVMNEQLLHLLVDYDYFSRTKIQVVATILTTVFLLQFTNGLFKEYLNKRFVKIISLLQLILIVIFLLTNGFKNSPSITTMVFQVAVVLGLAFACFCIFKILLKASFKKENDVGIILVIVYSLLLYLSLALTKAFVEINLGNAQAFLVLFMIFGAVVLIAQRFQLNYRAAVALSEKLLVYDKQKDEFLAKASHELKTPLHIILNLIRNLLEGRKGTLNTDQQEELLFVQQEGQRLTRLVVNLLNASKIKEGKTVLNFVPIDAFRVVDELLQEMALLIPREQPLVLNNQISRDFPLLKGDPDGFRQIVYNLVHNAIKHTEAGEIKVTATAVEGEAIIKVVDTGAGIKESCLDEIFNLFYQQAEGGNGAQGLGLGLPIVKQIVEAHGGKIEVDSTYGQGASFIFTLPLNTDPMKGEHSKKATILPGSPVIYPKKDKPKEGQAGSPTVLIVDDEPLNQRILVYIIEELGWNIVLADNGYQALDELEKNKIDLIILDYMLPDISGDMLCKQIREKYSLVELPVLILTASESTIDLLRGFDHGANDFQRKPINKDELIPRMQSLLLTKKTAEANLAKEMDYFTAQISPHFLYNTLNTIIGLSYKDGQQTRQALNNLSIYFRGKLGSYGTKGFTTLEEELELIKAYLEIEKMRHGARLGVVYQLEPGLKGKLPPLSLQPLVENSIRHGIFAKHDEGSIKISVRRIENDMIEILIEDDGIGMSEQQQAELLEGEHQGLGFKNVLKKIQRLPGAKFILESQPGKGTRATIIIPEEKNEGSSN